MRAIFELTSETTRATFEIQRVKVNQLRRCARILSPLHSVLKKFGGFDLAFMENGQYNRAWHAIHLLPNETAQASEDLQAAKIVPIHAGKFALARHMWNEPYKSLIAESEGRNYEILTPRIGELINFDAQQTFEPWFDI